MVQLFVDFLMTRVCCRNRMPSMRWYEGGRKIRQILHGTSADGNDNNEEENGKEGPRKRFPASATRAYIVLI